MSQSVAVSCEYLEAGESSSHCGSLMMNLQMSQGQRIGMIRTATVKQRDGRGAETGRGNQK